MNTPISKLRPGFLDRPKSIALAIGGIIALWSLMRENLVVLVLLAVVALFIIGLKKPLWAVVALLFTQLTIPSYMVNTPFVPISLRLLLPLFTLIFVGKAFINKEVFLGSYARSLIIPMLILMAISMVANLVNSGFDFAFKDFRNMLVGLLFFVFISAIIKNPNQLKAFCAILCIIVTTSAVICLMQNYNILGMAEATVRPGFFSLSLDPRAPGMSETQLEQSYILGAAFLVIFGIYLMKGVFRSKRMLLLISMVLIITGLYFTYTRSAILALGFGVLSVAFFVKSRIKWRMILILLFVVITFIESTSILEGTYFSGRSESSQLESSAGRVILWQAGIAMAIDNPVLGIGGDQFKSLSPQYAYAVDPALLQWEEDRYWNWRTLGTMQVHNDFIYVWVSYGTIALVAYIWFHFAVLHNCMISFRKSKNRFIKGLSLGLAGALVTYVINSFYHNLLITLPLLWILAGFSVVTAKLATEENNRKDIYQIHE